MALTQQSVVPRARLRQVQLGLGLGLEAGWLFAWSAVLGDALAAEHATPLIGLPLLAALLVAATLATRLAASRADEAGRARLAVSSLGVFVALWLGATALFGAGWPTDWPTVWQLLRGSGSGLRAIVTSGLTLLIWWRGIVAGRARPSLDTAEGGLRLAIGALALLFVLQVFAPRDPQVLASLAGAVLLVVSTGLLGLPLAAVQDQRERARYAGSPSPEIDGSWFGLLFGGVGALLLLTLLLAQSLSFERLDLVLAPLGQLLGTLAWFVIYPVALAIGYLVVALVWLLRLVIRPSEPHEMPRLTEMDWLTELREQVDQPDQLAGPFLPTLAVIVSAVLAVWLLARAARRLHDWRLPDDVDEVRDSVWSWDLRRAGLLQRLRTRFQRSGHLGGTVPPDQAAGTPAGNVRELYRGLLRLGIRRGRRRAADETPDEYERALFAAGLFSAGQTELHLLTSLYTQVRYGTDQPEPTIVAAARAALEQLEALEHPAQAG